MQEPRDEGQFNNTEVDDKVEEKKPTKSSSRKQKK